MSMTSSVPISWTAFLSRVRELLRAQRNVRYTFCIYVQYCDRNGRCWTMVSFEGARGRREGKSKSKTDRCATSVCWHVSVRFPLATKHRLYLTIVSFSYHDRQLQHLHVCWRPWSLHRRRSSTKLLNHWQSGLGGTLFQICSSAHWQGPGHAPVAALPVGRKPPQAPLRSRQLTLLWQLHVGMRDLL
jgi:hypothetical protein